MPNDLLEALCDTDDLNWVCDAAQSNGSVHVDLGPILGMPGDGPVVRVEELLGVVTDHEAPVVKLTWDDKTLTVSRHDDGTVMATFELKF